MREKRKMRTRKTIVDGIEGKNSTIYGNASGIAVLRKKRRTSRRIEKKNVISNIR